MPDIHSMRGLLGKGDCHLPRKSSAQSCIGYAGLQPPPEAEQPLKEAGISHISIASWGTIAKLAWC